MVHSLGGNHPWVSIFFGHVVLGYLFFPFFTLQKTHNDHHVWHHHESNDFGIPFFTKQNLRSPKGWSKEEIKVHRTFAKYPLANFLFWSVVGWPYYYLKEATIAPLCGGDYWTTFPLSKKIWSLVYQFICLAALRIGFGSWENLFLYHLAAFPVYHWFSMGVTFLQHHGSHRRIVFDDSTFNFLNAAMQTTNHKFGYGMDWYFHNGLQGHVVHHLFFEKIPTYRLMFAHEVLRDFLAEKGLSNLMLEDEEGFFSWNVAEFEDGHWAQLISSLPNRQLTPEKVSVQ
jgi:hypothetical protein